MNPVNTKIDNEKTPPSTELPTTSSSSVTEQGDISQDGPLSKSITGDSGKAEAGPTSPEVTADRDLEQSKPAYVQDESKLLHGSAFISHFSTLHHGGTLLTASLTSFR